MDAYINTKRMTFELPDGTIFGTESTKDYKFCLSYKSNDTYVVESLFKTMKGILARIDYLRRINWTIELFIVERKSKEYIYREVK